MRDFLIFINRTRVPAHRDFPLPLPAGKRIPEITRRRSKVKFLKVTIVEDAWHRLDYAVSAVPLYIGVFISKIIRPFRIYIIYVYIYIYYRYIYIYLWYIYISVYVYFYIAAVLRMYLARSRLLVYDTFCLARLRIVDRWIPTSCSRTMLSSLCGLFELRLARFSRAGISWREWFAVDRYAIELRFRSSSAASARSSSGRMQYSYAFQCTFIYIYVYIYIYISHGTTGSTWLMARRFRGGLCDPVCSRVIHPREISVWHHSFLTMLISWSSVISRRKILAKVISLDISRNS
jgi:hypothetical protein